MEDAKEPLFPEYGLNGDQAGARRNRRAFRFSVLACVVFTLGLWHTDRYLRYDLTEAQYRMALTLETDSARAILRNVVKRDSANNEAPTAKYVEALASIEEDDVILSRYADAYKLNPGNASLIINYGCRLFLFGQYKDARERFREASVLPPKNALPRYLEAAALVMGNATEEDVVEAMALIARTNNSGEPVLFPQPLWHSSLPTQGAWYAKSRREIADRCCAPLYAFQNTILGKAKTDLDTGQIRNWDSWLRTIQTMGERVMGAGNTEESSLGVSQAVAGLQIQLDALRAIKRVEELANGTPDLSLAEKSKKLEDALNGLKQFEDVRNTQMQAHRRVLILPLQLSGWALLAFGAVFALPLLVYRVSGIGRKCWTLPHSRLCKIVLVTGLGCLLCLLFLMMALNNSEMGKGGLLFIRLIWGLVATILVFFGVAYPSTILPRASILLENRRVLEQNIPSIETIRRYRRMAYISLLRRYFGMLMGGFCVVLCLWVIGFRIVESLYPIQMPLLVTGLDREELDLIHHALRLLSTSSGGG